MMTCTHCHPQVLFSHRYYAGARHGLGVAKLPEDVEQRTALALPSVARAPQNDVSLFLGQIKRLCGNMRRYRKKT